MTPGRVSIDTLARRLPAPPRTRFAPSPTGHLHLGHVVNAIYTWGVARALKGTVVLRMEDHDRTRCQLEYERSIIDDLDWLGLRADEPRPAEAAFATRAWRQSDATDRYVAAVDALRAQGRVYVCDCSRRTIAAAADGDASGREVPYPGRCRRRGLDDRPDRGLRARLDPGVERFDDSRLGAQEQTPAEQCGDLLLRDRHGCWTYQFAVTADDIAHDIMLVVRGEDLLASTGRQMALARLLDRPAPPLFLHHPLICDARGEKLSKSRRDTGVRELRAAGWTPGQVLGAAAAAVGLVSPSKSGRCTLEPASLSEAVSR